MGIGWSEMKGTILVEPYGCVYELGDGDLHLPQIPIFGTFTIKASVMSKNTSISLGDYFENFVQHSISEGRFKNASEVVRAGLRLLEEEENKVLALKKAIQDGMNSPRVEDFNFDEHLSNLKNQKK